MVDRIYFSFSVSFKQVTYTTLIMSGQNRKSFCISHLLLKTFKYEKEIIPH